LGWSVHHSCAALVLSLKLGQQLSAGRSVRFLLFSVRYGPTFEIQMHLPTDDGKPGGGGRRRSTAGGVRFATGAYLSRPSGMLCL
jgi:hypothetical protein